MPKILDKAISEIMKTWKDEVTARKIAIKSLQRAWDLKPWTITATSKWIKRGNMTPWQRLKTRIEKYKNKSAMRSWAVAVSIKK